MKMKLGFRLIVTPSSPSEVQAAQKLNEEIARLDINGKGGRRAVRFDESLLNDFNRILTDLHQLMNRADARRRKNK